MDQLDRDLTFFVGVEPFSPHVLRPAGTGSPYRPVIETARRFTPAGFSLPSIKCNPDPARLSPDDVTLVIAVLRVDN